MAFKFIVFDLDGTIVDVGSPIKTKVTQKLRKLERRGHKIVLASGKNISYLQGFVRGIGVNGSYIIGENGCVVFDKMRKKTLTLALRPKEISMIENAVLKKFSDSVWLPTNQVELTIFPKNKRTLRTVARFLKKFERLSKIIILEHEDAIDLLPLGINKGKALLKIIELEKIARNDVVAVGDAKNDIPILEQAGFPLIIGNKLPDTYGQRFPDITMALDFLETFT